VREGIAEDEREKWVSLFKVIDDTHTHTLCTFVMYVYVCVDACVCLGVSLFKMKW
jgi:hypothetical protein